MKLQKGDDMETQENKDAFDDISDYAKEKLSVGKGKKRDFGDLNFLHHTGKSKPSNVAKKQNFLIQAMLLLMFCVIILNLLTRGAIDLFGILIFVTLYLLYRDKCN